MKACVSLASWPGLPHAIAAENLLQEIQEPCLGQLSVEHVQLVPQNAGILSEELVDQMVARHPSTQFRLHANVRVLGERRIADLSGFAAHDDWFRRAAGISQRLKAPAYTAHAGSRRESSMREMLENARRCADLFDCPVGVEGHYPVKGDIWLVSSWEEYRELFDSTVPYALDLSHLNIVAACSGRTEESLVREMLNCERCIEVHVSENDGSGDWHQVCQRPAWWFELLPYVNSGAVIFSEGNHRLRRTHK